MGGARGGVVWEWQLERRRRRAAVHWRRWRGCQKLKGIPIAREPHVAARGTHTDRELAVTHGPAVGRVSAQVARRQREGEVGVAAGRQQRRLGEAAQHERRLARGLGVRQVDLAHLRTGHVAPVGDAYRETHLVRVRVRVRARARVSVRFRARARARARGCE
eukprot:scaffold1338_cov63-Phaeocystis_antarctica.AAC.4